MFYALAAGILYKAYEEHMAGGSLYEFMKDEFRSALEFLRSELVKTAESAGAAGGTFASGLGEGIGAGLKGLGEGIAAAVRAVVSAPTQPFVDMYNSASDDIKKLLKKFSITSSMTITQVASVLNNIMKSLVTDPQKFITEIGELTQIINWFNSWQTDR